MSVNKYINGKLLQVSGNADTRLTFDDIISILGYTPVNPNIIGTELATLNSSGKLEDSQKPSYSWSEITGKPSTFTPSSHTHNYAGSSSTGGAATSALTLTTARTLTIGNSGKTFDGSTDVSWSLSEIGAASQSDLDILNSNKVNGIIYLSGGDANVLQNGLYMLNVWSGAEAWSNLPEYPGGFAILISCVNPDWVSNIQIYFSGTDGKIYQRQYYDGVWHDWSSN